MVYRVVCILFLLISLCWLSGCGGDEKPVTSQTEEQVAKRGRKRTSRTDFVLPEDADKLNGLLKYELSVEQPEYITLKVLYVKREITITIPRGTRAVASEPDMPAYVIAQDSVIKLKPTAGRIEHYGIRGLVTDVKHWGMDKLGGAYKLEKPLVQSSLYHYVSKLSKLKKYNWLHAQIGAWVVADNISLKRLAKLRIKISRGFQKAGKIAFRVYAYKTVKETGKLLATLGYRPETFTLIKQNREKYEKAVADYQLMNWDQKLKVGYVGNVFNPLTDYQDEPVVKQLLIEYMKNHSISLYREQALDKLLEFGGIDGSSDVMLDVALNAPDRMLRIGAAKTLWKRNDDRAIPLLLVYQYEKPMMKKSNNTIRQQLEKTSGQKIADTDNLLQLWQKSGGWKELKKKYGGMDKLEKGVRNLLLAEKQFMAQELERLNPDDEQQYKLKLKDFYRRFPHDKSVVEALKKKSRNLKNNDLRLAALNTILDFNDFSHFDYLSERLKNDHFLPIKKRIINLPGVSDKQKAELLEIALKCADSRVKIEAANYIEQHQLKSDRLNHYLADIAKRSPSIDARVAAMEALLATEAPSAFDVVKYNAWQRTRKYLKLAERALNEGSKYLKTDQMLELLKQLAVRHPQSKIRRAALSRFSQLPPDKSMLRVLEQCLKKDKKERVRMAALAEAAQLAATKEFKDAGLGAVISMALRDSGVKTRKQAITLIEKYKLTDLVPELEKTALKDDSKAIQQFAFQKVRKFDDKKGLEIIKQWLDDKYPDVQRLGVDNLIRYYAKHPEARALLAPFKKSADKTIRRKVQLFLK